MARQTRRDVTQFTALNTIQMSTFRLFLSPAVGLSANFFPSAHIPPVEWSQCPPPR
jgi:hypothetical protein